MSPGLLDSLLCSGMTDQECTVDRTLSPLQPLDAGLLGVCVCLSVLECVNALLRLPEFICLVSSGATPFYSFHAKVSPCRPPLLSCLLFCLSLFASDCSVRKMNRNKAFHIVNLRHEHREPVDISLNSMQPLMLNLSASQMWLGCTPSLSFLVLCPSDGVFAHTVRVCIC